MDWNQLIPAAVALNTVITFLTAIYTLLTSSAKKTATDLSAHITAAEKRHAELISVMAKYDRRIQAVEDDVKHRPDRDAAHKLELLVEKLSGRLDTIDERLKPVAAISDRLQDFLLEHAKK